MTTPSSLTDTFPTDYLHQYPAPTSKHETATAENEQTRGRYSIFIIMRVFWVSKTWSAALHAHLVLSGGRWKEDVL